MAFILSDEKKMRVKIIKKFSQCNTTVEDSDPGLDLSESSLRTFSYYAGFQMV